MITIYQIHIDTNKVEQVDRNSFDSSTIIDKNYVTWIDLFNPTQEEEDFILRDTFHFHSLTVEDCRSESHHPKIDDFTDYLFVIMHGVRPRNQGNEFDTVNISSFIGENYLVTHHREESESVNKALTYCIANPKSFSKGPDNIYHMVIDDMVDAYLPVLDVMDNMIDEIENEIFTSARNTTLSKILTLKKDVMRLRRVATHQKEVLNRLSRGEFDLVTDEERIYYRDVYDHLVRIADLAETYRDLISGSLDAYLSVVSNRMNEVMKTLTIIATIILPLSLIAGIYGMNFEHMPELNWKWGYPLALALMAAITLVMLAYFKRRKWF